LSNAHRRALDRRRRSDPLQIRKVVDETMHAGRIDILVNNAGATWARRRGLPLAA